MSLKTFYLIDGHAQLFRAYYAPFRDLTSPSGEPVKAVYVFTQMLLTLLRNEKPDYLAVTFDVSDATTHRKGWYPEYKANRERSPEDLEGQFMKVREVIEALKLPVFELEGFEADDVIATIAELTKGEPVELRIASKDKDLHQILTPKVKLWDPSKGDLLDDELLRIEKGYGPEQAVEIQTLVGDSTDNIPGARGVGVKTAVKLINQYGSADEVLANVADLTPKLRENLLAHAETMDLTRRLVTLDRNVPIEFDLSSCVTPDVDPTRVRPLLEQLGFRTLVEQLDSDHGAPAGTSKANKDATAGSAAAVAPTAPDPADLQSAETEYQVVSTPEQLTAFVAELAEQAGYALDTETTGLLAVDADVVGYAFSWAEGRGYYLPVRGNWPGDHLTSGARLDYLDPDLVAAALKPVLEDPTTLKIGQNLKYDINVLARAGIDLSGSLFDTMIAAALLYPERRTNNMDDLARDLLSLKTTPIAALIGKGKASITMLEVPLPQVAAYAAEDADVTWRLYQLLDEKLAAAPAAMQKLFREVEMPLVRVLAAMEGEGVELDVEQLRAYASVLQNRVTELKQQLFDAAGCEFNPDSPKQLGEVLFDKLGLPVIKRTKTARSTDAEVLERLAAESEHPLPLLLLEYRELTKLLGTYVHPLPSYLARSTGRLHTSFHQTGAATGRLSSSDPNIQNIPIRTEAGREIRRAFRAGPERLLVTADYSQVELRMLAHFSADEELARAFREGLDIHAYVASQIFDVELPEVDPQQRRVAKTVNFGIVYGQSAFGLARTLRIPQREAASFISAYKERYTGLERFLQQCIAEAEENGYVTTILGRRRGIEEIRSRNRNLRQLGERLAINTVIQGSAADLIKVAMVQLQERLESEHPESRLLIQVHDELVLEAPAASAQAVLHTTVDVMSGALTLSVPLKVDAALGPNWLERGS